MPVLAASSCSSSCHLKLLRRRRQLSESSLLTERVDHAAKPYPHDGFDAGNIGAVTLQQRYVTDSFLKAATVE